MKTFRTMPINGDQAHWAGEGDARRAILWLRGFCSSLLFGRTPNDKQQKKQNELPNSLSSVGCRRGAHACSRYAWCGHWTRGV